VIEKRPHEFKIECLRGIQRLFPAARKPFYAGFGNRPTDVQSYLEVGVNPSRVFIVNPEGIVKTPAHHQLFNTSYASLASDLVDHIFPPLNLQMRLSGALGAPPLPSTSSFGSALGENRFSSDDLDEFSRRGYSECETDFTVPPSAPSLMPPPTPTPASTEADNFAAHAGYNTFLYWQQLPH
jgi:hypothetical protein